jgi:hypothetical protein
MSNLQYTRGPVRREADVHIHFERTIRQQRHGARDLAPGGEPAGWIFQSDGLSAHTPALVLASNRKISSRRFVSIVF